MTKKNGSIGIHIDGGKGTEHTKRVVGELSRHLGRAIELGREAVAVELVRALSETAGVKNVAVTGCHIGTGQ